jgi:hypothetical protein
VIVVGNSSHPPAGSRSPATWPRCAPCAQPRRRQHASALRRFRVRRGPDRAVSRDGASVKADLIRRKRPELSWLPATGGSAWRRGKKRALVAVGNSIRVIAWHLLSDPAARLADLGPQLARPPRLARPSTSPAAWISTSSPRCPAATSRQRYAASPPGDPMPHRVSLQGPGVSSGPFPAAITRQACPPGAKRGLSPASSRAGLPESHAPQAAVRGRRRARVRRARVRRGAQLRVRRRP